MTIHALFSLLTLFELSSRSQRLFFRALYYLKLSRYPACLRKLDKYFQSPSIPCDVTVTSSAQQWSTLPTLSSSLGGGVEPASNEQGFWFHACAIPHWPVSLSPNLVTKSNWLESKVALQHLALCFSRTSIITCMRLTQSVLFGKSMWTVRFKCEAYRGGNPKKSSGWHPSDI